MNTEQGRFVKRREVHLPPSSSYDSFIEVLPKGKYKIYLTVYNKKCKAKTYTKTFEVKGKLNPRPTVPEPKECCKWSQITDKQDDIPSNKRVYGCLTLINVTFYTSITAYTVYQERKRNRWKNIKAKFLRVDFGGNYYLWGCNGAPHSINDMDDGTNVKKVRIVSRHWQPRTLKEHSVSSTHSYRADSNGEFYLHLANCK